MNQQQHKFVDKALQQLRQVVDQCGENSATATSILGRRRVGRHIVVVRIIAELDEGFAAPLNSHASQSSMAQTGNSQYGDASMKQPGRSSTIEPDYSRHTEHHNKSNRINRWHKPLFDL